MTIQLIDKWLKFCINEQQVDKSEFYTLFLGKLTEEEIKTIFSPFKHSEKLEKRLLNVKSVQPQLIDYADRNEHILTQIKNDVSSKKSICSKQEDDELESILNNATITFVTEQEFENIKNSEEAWPNEEVMDLVGDTLRDEIENYTEKTSILTEAFYHLTNDYNLVWYLMVPFYGDYFCNNSYYELWRTGVEYVITEEGIFAWDRNKH